MTHAATSPPDNPQTGEQMGYEMYVTNRIHILQQIVRCGLYTCAVKRIYVLHLTMMFAPRLGLAIQS